MSKLFIVPTPIGNLEDITIRAIATLKSVDLILAEDTRTSLKLLNHFEIECLPGATSLIPALVNSGLPSDRFIFEGFLPIKKGRTRRLKEIADEKRTVIFYESPHRILKTLNDLSTYFSEDIRISISRELTKMYEENFRGTIKESIEYFQKKKPKGEFVIILSPN